MWAASLRTAIITDTGGRGEGVKAAFLATRVTRGNNSLYTIYSRSAGGGLTPPFKFVARPNGARAGRENMFGSETVFSPGLLLSVWAAGVAGAGAVTAWWRIVGRGYHRLGAAVALLIGGGAWYFDPHPLVILGAAAAAAGLAVGRFPAWTAASQGAAAVFWGARAVMLSSSTAQAAAVVTGALALGGITAGMLLGHWYLVSPQIPRWALRALSLGGAAGVALDAATLGAWAGLEGSPLSLTVFFSLAAVSALLAAGVWFALGEPTYTGVMAATGLGYLAVLTALGFTALGRTLALI